MKDLYADYYDALLDIPEFTEEQRYVGYKDKTLYQIFLAMRTYSKKTGSTTQRIVMSPLLNSIVGKTCKWTQHQCARCFEGLLKEYAKDKDYPDLLLAVSGFIEEYDSDGLKLKDRRTKYAEAHPGHSVYVLEKREQKMIEEMTDGIVEDYRSDCEKLRRIVAISIGQDGLMELGLSELAPFISSANTTAPLFRDEGWGDNSSNKRGFSQRRTYTASEIAHGVLEERTATFNSIVDDANNETKFVSVCKTSELESGRRIKWENGSVEVRDGETYTIRMYIHNDNPNGRRAIAEKTRIKFVLPTEISNEQELFGYITASNANPTEYWASVTLMSQTNVFSVKYINGTCVMRNTATHPSGCKLKQFQNDKYIMIGYDYLDGEFPGGSQYSAYVDIHVQVVFEAQCRIKTTQRVQNNPDKSWCRTTRAGIGDLVECQFYYRNTGDVLQENVMVRHVLPDNMKYISDSTVLYNSNYQKGVGLQDNTITTSGINIGHYNPQGDAYIRFMVRIVDNTLDDGLSCLVNWGAVTIEGKVAKDNAQLYVAKRKH